MNSSVFVAFAILFASVGAISFGSSDESCEDSHEHGGGRPGGGRPGGGNGNGGGGNRGCPSGWLRFNRPSGGWCVRVFSGVLSQADSEARCQTQGAVLSGLQSQAEANAIGNAALSIFSQQSGSIRIGLVRTRECSTSPISTDCGSMNSFYWTDKSASGTTGLIWNNNQPDNAHGATQKCVVLLASRTPRVTDKWTWEANRLDDVGCEAGIPDNSPRTMRGFVCGKRST